MPITLTAAQKSALAAASASTIDWANLLKLIQELITLLAGNTPKAVAKGAPKGADCCDCTEMLNHLQTMAQLQVQLGNCSVACLTDLASCINPPTL